jgi:hypothetical protein
VLVSTTADLHEGSTKATAHVPGYGGYVPAAPRTDAYEQGRGAAPRDSFHAKTHLGTTFHKRMPGFGGYVPAEGGVDALAVRKGHGLHAATDYGIANSLADQYWRTHGALLAAKAAGAE